MSFSSIGITTCSNRKRNSQSSIIRTKDDGKSNHCSSVFYFCFVFVYFYHGMSSRDIGRNDYEKFIRSELEINIDQANRLIKYLHLLNKIQSRIVSLSSYWNSHKQILEEKIRHLTNEINQLKTTHVSLFLLFLEKFHSYFHLEFQRLCYGNLSIQRDYSSIKT